MTSGESTVHGPGLCSELEPESLPSLWLQKFCPAQRVQEQSCGPSRTSVFHIVITVTWSVDPKASIRIYSTVPRD
jgi:hypothetical protein